MPRLATGTLYQNPPNSGIFYIQLTLGKTPLGKPKRRSFPLPTCQNEAAAQERMELLAGLARRLRVAGREDLVEEMVDRAASAEGRALDEVLRTVDLIIAGKLAGVPKEPEPIPTIRQLGTKWTSGELNKLFPDHIKKKSTADDDAGRLEKYVYPVIGEIPIDAFTLEHANLVMAGVPAERSPATRRHVAQLLHRICAMALFLLRFIKTNPLPEGFLPPIPAGKAKGWLYPDEDAKLLAAKPVPLEWRVFYEFLHREGLRFTEAARLTWADVDLERGILVLDKNKTNDPRAWAMSRGVVLAFRVFRIIRARQGIAVGPSDLVFTDERGQKISSRHQADRYRGHLADAGIDRASLFERTKARQPIRIHDTRATFITIALANGKSEAWVQDRTGHKSSQMINRYKRAARTAAELALGNLAPLVQAIPELARLVPEKATVKATPSPITALMGLLKPQGFQSSSPTRTRTGTTARSRDFKFDRGDFNGRDPCDSAGFDEASQRLNGPVAFSDPSVAFSSDLPDDYFDTSNLLSTCPNEATSLTHEQLEALASNPQVVGLLQAMAVMMASGKGE